MPDQSTILSLPHILPSQAQKHVTHNEALRLLDVMVQLAVTQRLLSAPPALPVLGDRHIVGAAPSGAWAGQAQQIALWNGTAWEFFAPLAGWRAYVAAEAAVVTFDGAAWVLPTPVTQLTQLGIAMAADGVNKLAVASAAALFTNPAGSHRLAISKAAAGDTGSVLLQTNFVTHAELGLVADNHLSLKVSADGSSFVTALRADKDSGRVALDQPVQLVPAAGDAAGVSDGFLWYNSTTGKFRARQGGASVDLIGAGGSGPVFSDADFRIADNLDATKLAAFQTGGLTTGTTRTFTLPDADGTLALTADLAAYQPLDGDLTVIAGLTAATDSFLQAKAGAWAARTVAEVKTDLGLTGTNSGDQTSIAGISGTKAQFDAAVSDGNIQFVGDAPTAHTHLLAAGASDVTITAANLNALDDGVNTALHFHDADRARANHTGTQAAATISDFAEAVDDRVAALLVAGTNMTLTYNDAAGTLTLDAAGGGAGTDLAYTPSTRLLASSTGADVTLPLAGADAGLMSPADKTKLDAVTGTNTGDQTSIIGISGTKAQFDAAVSDGNIQFVGDAPTAHTHLLAAGASDVTITAANLNALDDGVNTALHFHDADRARANHTGTQAAATISDFSAAADARIAAASVNALADVTITAPSTGQVLKYNGSAWINDTDATGGGGGGTVFADDVFRIEDNTDPTKEVAFELSGVTTGTTRTLTVPNADGVIALTSGLQVPFLIPVANDHVMTTMGSGTTTGSLAGAANRMEIYPFAVRVPITVTGLSVNCQTAVAASLVKIVVYSSDANGRPDALLLETGTLDTGTTGVKTIAASLTLEVGKTYWFGVRHSSTSTLTHWGNNATPDLNGGAPSTSVRKVFRRTLTFATGAPATWGYTASELGTTAAPAVWIRV